jgi:hypothetical protein
VVAGAATSLVDTFPSSEVQVTLYFRIGDPPSERGLSHVTVAFRSQTSVPGKEASTLSGADGWVATVNIADAGDARLAPAPLETTTVQV